jgi:DNA-binding NarL/FixJ family response regulator
VVARIGEIAERTDSDLVGARAEHVRAVADGRAEPMLIAATALEYSGLLLAAAEALCCASMRFERDGERRRSRAIMVDARQLIARLDGARTPGLAPAAAVVELTSREREIAVLAAQGQSSKDIAARLVLSARTVDNHLQRVYDKLGVNSRQALADALAE